MVLSNLRHPRPSFRFHTLTLSWCRTSKSIASPNFIVSDETLGASLFFNLSILSFISSMLCSIICCCVTCNLSLFGSLAFYSAIPLYCFHLRSHLLGVNQDLITYRFPCFITIFHLFLKNLLTSFLSWNSCVVSSCASSCSHLRTFLAIRLNLSNPSFSHLVGWCIIFNPLFY